MIRRFLPANSSRMRSVTAAAALALAAVVGIGGSLTQSAFTGKISSAGNTVGIAVQDTCRIVQSGSSAYIAYALTGQASSETNLGTSGSKRNGTYTTAAASTTMPMGCTLDTPVSAFITGGSRFLYSNSTVPSVSSSSTVTEEIWFKTTTASGMLMGIGDSQSGVDRSSSSTEGLAVFLTSTGKLDFATSDGSTTRELLSSSSYLDGKWHDVMAVYNRGTKVLYVDGASVGSASGSSQTLSSCYWRLGADNLSGWTYSGQSSQQHMLYFTGSLQYAAYYTSALSASDASGHYAASS